MQTKSGFFLGMCCCALFFFLSNWLSHCHIRTVRLALCLPLSRAGISRAFTLDSILVVSSGRGKVKQTSSHSLRALVLQAGPFTQSAQALASWADRWPAVDPLSPSALTPLSTSQQAVHYLSEDRSLHHYLSYPLNGFFFSVLCHIPPRKAV